MSETIPSGNSEASSQGGALDTTSSQSSAEEMVSKKSIESIVQKRLKSSHAQIAQLQKELSQYKGGDEEEVEKERPSANPLEAEYKNKLQRADREKKSLLEKLDRHRQSTLKAQVQQKLIEKDCIDPEVVFTDLKERGLVKLDDNDEVVVGGIYDDLDSLVDDYLSKKDYLRRSKASGGVGSKAPGINAASGSFNKQAIIDQVRAAQTQGKKLFGK